MSPLLLTIVVALWLMLPAYITNASAAFFGGKTPIDRGIYWGKHRLLGDGKTYEGLVTGFACGVLIGLMQQVLQGRAQLQLPDFGSFPLCLVTLACLCAGAMLGDLLGSFVKRRAGVERGAPLPLLDQLDFVAGAWLLLLLFAREWFIAAFSWDIILAVIMLTPLLHLATNYVGFKIGRKKVPW
ncbi:MAG: CDP-2,3-bis-(O-geranylgeranyl)-sn-glycerol synthase [Candidatus Methanospirareceae archaeon]